MNKLFFVLVIVFTSVYITNAQGSLQFNQVKLIDNTEETVPEGKVWKIVGVAGTQVLQHDRSGGNYSIPNAINPAKNRIIINGNTIDVGIPAIGAGAGAGYNNFLFNTAYSNIPTNFPLWLPENTSLQASDNIKYISVIEFNIIQ